MVTQRHYPVQDKTGPHHIEVCFRDVQAAGRVCRMAQKPLDAFLRQLCKESVVRFDLVLGEQDVGVRCREMGEDAGEFDAW